MGNWALTLDSKGIRGGHFKVTPRTLEKYLVTRALDALGHLGTQGTWALRHLSTRALEGHLDTQALGHSKHSRHFIYMTRENSGSCFYLTFRDVKSIREYEKGS